MAENWPVHSAVMDGSGEGVPHIIERLKQLRMKVADGFRVRFKPGEDNLIDAF